MGHGSLGLSCVLVQGLLLLGYAYRVSALWAIPRAPLETEDHLRHAIVRMKDVRLVRNVLLTDRHSISLLSLSEANQSIDFYPMLLHHSLVRHPIIDDELERSRIVVTGVPHCVLVYLYARPEGYSERSSQVGAFLVPTSIRLRHISGQMNILYNHIINRKQGASN